MRRWASRHGFTLIELLIVMGIIGILASLLAPAYVSARRESRMTDCQNNMRQLGTLLATYVSRYGEDRAYPSNGPMPGGAFGTGPPAGPTPNGIFWAFLWRVPAQDRAVSFRSGAAGGAQDVGDNRLFACPVLGTPQLSSTIIEYTCPRLAAVWRAPFGSGAVFPNGRLSDVVRPDTFIGGDIIQGPFPPGTTGNHGGGSLTPQNPFSGLVMDGHVETVSPAVGGAMFNLYNDHTTGTRGP
ncbi:MAG: type II secretion system protein [Planctomycetes bacterium]|nr:type II secretion system protein [Planctomycetota bacterium]